MRPVRSIWLAGPEPWLPDAEAQAARQRAFCADNGFTGLTAPAVVETQADNVEVQARELYAERMAKLRQADAGIINLTPFRGPSCASAAAFEAGVLAGLGRPVVAYVNVADESEAEYVDRVEVHVGAQRDEHGVWRDGDGCVVEDFGLPETLMLWAEARRLFVIITDDPLHDLTGLEMCLEALALYAE
ncbi:nucleoside 2-deoxyribosyltransferase [Caulobacter sp. BK020]|uniref:nucleoside 2-deoxyribosyltransferase n=1 Tax=Caulobacter sp. BK020 TaxID=2512117 RepID=UPI00104C3875|nr:nucleoside 2-deoxyribosyltransferase [Caulobacter sp. BK020]TCS15852.1 nucleoside 2-deoxyribosyltransferase [Caulobacter sp. BK020]